MSDGTYEFSIEDAQSLVRDLIRAGWLPIDKSKSDQVLVLAKILQPLVQQYMPTWFPEGGGP